MLISEAPQIPLPSVPSLPDAETAVQTVGRLLAWPVVVTLIVVGAVLARWVLHRVIDRVVRRMAASSVSRRLAATGQSTSQADDELAERLALRGRTVAGVLKSVSTLLVFGFAAVAILATVGVNVAPLIATAGVVGIAIGFGAQSLVRDFLTGIFMILEDQYAVGDVVDTGQAVGTVDSVGLRVTQLRDDQGVVWYVPHGSIQRVGNRSQGFGLAVVDIPLAYGTDVDAASEVVRRAVASLAADPTWADDLTSEPVVSVESMTSSGVTLQVRQHTPPLRNAPVGRAIRERVLADLEDAGIPRPTA